MIRLKPIYPSLLKQSNNLQSGREIKTDNKEILANLIYLNHSKKSYAWR